MPNMTYNETMKKEDLIYVAGLIDGDGCITTSFQSFRLTLSNTDKRMILWLQRTFGGNVNNQHLPENPKWNPSWKWVICAKEDLKTFLELISPYLKFKREQAILVLNFLRKYPKHHGRKTSEAEKQEYLKVKNQLKRLKLDRHYQR